MYLDKRIILKNGYRKLFLIKFKLSFFSKVSHFKYRPNKKRNRLLNNQLNLRSQISVKKKLIFIKTCPYNNIVLLKFSLNFIINSINNKIMTLFCTSNGCFFYSITSTKDKLFKFYYFYKIRAKRRYKLKRHWYYILKLKKRKKICLFSTNQLGLINTAKAVGSFAKIVQINKKDCLAFIKLPSKKQICLTAFTLVSRGVVRKLYKKKLPNFYASFNRLMGKKSNSRGVAMNPVDHPHGGRTKSIRLPRTPWGLVTKKK